MFRGETELFLARKTGGTLIFLARRGEPVCMGRKRGKIENPASRGKLNPTSVPHTGFGL